MGTGVRFGVIVHPLYLEHEGEGPKVGVLKRYDNRDLPPPKTKQIYTNPA
jgi:hypothetical protein